MGIRHKRFAMFGVQFHPESFLTQCGSRILEHFLAVEQPSSHRGAQAIN
jgi:anthranilate/para-aminobenzoate synthase component II